MNLFLSFPPHPLVAIFMILVFTSNTRIIVQAGQDSELVSSTSTSRRLGSSLPGTSALMHANTKNTSIDSAAARIIGGSSQHDAIEDQPPAQEGDNKNKKDATTANRSLHSEDWSYEDDWYNDDNGDDYHDPCGKGKGGKGGKGKGGKGGGIRFRSSYQHPDDNKKGYSSKGKGYHSNGKGKGGTGNRCNCNDNHGKGKGKGGKGKGKGNWKGKGKGHWKSNGEGMKIKNDGLNRYGKGKGKGHYIEDDDNDCSNPPTLPPSPTIKTPFPSPAPTPSTTSTPPSSAPTDEDEPPDVKPPLIALGCVFGVLLNFKILHAWWKRKKAKKLQQGHINFPPPAVPCDDDDSKSDNSSDYCEDEEDLPPRKPLPEDDCKNTGESLNFIR
jgi:hypothetical protein